MPGTSGNIISYRRKFRSQIFRQYGQMEKAEVGRVRDEQRRREKIREEKEREERRGRCAKRYEGRGSLCFSMICSPGGSRIRLAKAAGAEPCGQMRDEKNCTPLWCEAHFEAKMYNAHHSRTTFGKLRYRKSARPCSAKHIWKSNVLKTDGRGPLLEVEMLKICTLVWREARLEVKMFKKHRMLGPLLKVQMWFCLAGARDFAPCQK